MANVLGITSRPRNPQPIPSRSFPNSKRTHGRVVVEAIYCSLGEILDASAAGMRILTTKKTKLKAQDIVRFTVNGPTGPFELEARVMWITQRGWKWYEFGVQFISVTPEGRQGLTTLAASAAGNTTFPTSIRLREAV